MTDTYVDDAPDVEEDAPAVEEDPAPEGGEAEGDEAEEPEKRPQDWEKQAHNAKGQAAKERSRRRAAERRASDLEERLSALETRGGASEDDLMAIIGQLQDDDEDPVGDIAKVKAALKVIRDRNLADTERETHQTALAKHFEGLRVAMVESETDFAADTPDYHDAAKFYRQARVEELEDAGYTGNALQRKLADDLYGVVRMAIEGGMDPAERVYALAKRRGFKAGDSASGKKVDVLRRAAEAGRRPTGGAPAGGALTMEEVASMDGPKRDAAFAKLRAQEKARERGRR